MPRNLVKNQNLEWVRKELVNQLVGNVVKTVLLIEFFCEINFYLLNEHDDNFGVSAQVVR